MKRQMKKYVIILLVITVLFMNACTTKGNNAIESDYSWYDKFEVSISQFEVIDNFVYCELDDHTLIKVNPETGEVISKLNLDLSYDKKLLRMNKLLVLVSSYGNILVFEPQNMTIVADFNAFDLADLSRKTVNGAFIIDSNIIISSEGEEEVFSIDIQKLSVNWIHKDINSSSIYYSEYDGELFYNDNGKFNKLNLEDGTASTVLNKDLGLLVNIQYGRAFFFIEKGIRIYDLIEKRMTLNIKTQDSIDAEYQSEDTLYYTMYGCIVSIDLKSNEVNWMLELPNFEGEFWEIIEFDKLIYLRDYEGNLYVVSDTGVYLDSLSIEKHSSRFVKKFGEGVILTSDNGELMYYIYEEEKKN